MRKKASKCPMCPKLLRSQKFVLYHLTKEHSWLVDHLVAPIVTQRRRGRRIQRSLAALPPPPPPCQMAEKMAVLAYAPPPPLPPPCMDLTVYDEKMDIKHPVKKRWDFTKNVALKWNHYICDICGKVLNKPTALGGHKAHHTMARKRNEKKKTIEQEKMMGIHVPEKKPRQRFNNRPWICSGCEKEFKSGQGLGGHKRHCKGRALWIDLNNLPEEMMEE